MFRAVRHPGGRISLSEFTQLACQRGSDVSPASGRPCDPRRMNESAPLTDSEIDAFLDERHSLVLATLRRDGTPHLTTVWYRWDGSSLWITTNDARAKYRNIQRDPRVSALIDAPARESAVTVYGAARVAARGDGAYEGAMAVVSRYVEDGAAYLAARSGEGRVLIEIVPERIVSWKLSDEAASGPGRTR